MRINKIICDCCGKDCEHEYFTVSLLHHERVGNLELVTGDERSDDFQKHVCSKCINDFSFKFNTPKKPEYQYYVPGAAASNYIPAYSIGDYSSKGGEGGSGYTYSIQELRTREYQERLNEEMLKHIWGK